MKNLITIITNLIITCLLTSTSSFSQSTKLIRAAEDGNIDAFNKVTSIASINQRDEQGYTPLMAASLKGHKDIVEILLSKGANPNLKNNQLNTALHFALYGKHPRIATVLINNNAEITANMSDITPLHQAAKAGYIEVVKQIIEKGGNVNQKSKITGETPFLNALESNNDELIDYLIIKGAEIVDKNKSNVTSLMLAAKSNKLSLLQDLLSKGLDVNEKSKKGETALHFAAKEGHKEIMEFLISKGANLSAITIDSSSVLGNAVLSKNIEAVKLILSNQVDVNIRSSKNYTPLILASANADIEIVKLLLENKANVNLCGTDLVSPVGIAAFLENIELIKLLVSKGYKLNLFSDAEFLPITIAAEKQNFDISDILYNCETNYLNAISLLDKLKTCSSDSISILKANAKTFLSLSLAEVNKRKEEYAGEVASIAARNFGINLLSAMVARPGTYYNTISGGNELNKAVLNSLKKRAEFLEKKIAGL